MVQMNQVKCLLVPGNRLITSQSRMLARKLHVPLTTELFLLTSATLLMPGNTDI